MTTALAGFTLGLSLILAIGAQNAFVLRQGLARAHVLPVVLTCALSDAVLIAAGRCRIRRAGRAGALAAGRDALGRRSVPAVYGALAFRQRLARRRGAGGGAGRPGSRRKAILTCLAFTWLNPHVYLDTVVLLGSVAAATEGSRWAFGLGAVTASFVFFFALGYGARALAPIFARPVDLAAARRRRRGAYVAVGGGVGPRRMRGQAGMAGTRHCGNRRR